MVLFQRGSHDHYRNYFSLNRLALQLLIIVSFEEQFKELAGKNTWLFQVEIQVEH